jgi:predicted metal-dependent peptidase
MPLMQYRNGLLRTRGSRVLGLTPLGSQKNIFQNKITSKGVWRYYLWRMRQSLPQSYCACQRKGVRRKVYKGADKPLRRVHTCVKRIFA